MRNENYDNVSWKDKLDNLSSLPGEPFNASQVWEKLHGRLQQKHAAKKKMLLWSLAACLLSAIVLSWLLTGTKEASFATKNPVQKHSSEIQNSIKTSLLIPRREEIKVLSDSRKKLPKTSIVVTHKTSSASHLITANKTISDTGSFIQSNDFANEIASVQADTFHLLTTKITRPKLRVVHINELGKTAEEVKYARNEGALFPIKINSKDIFSGTPTRSNSDHSILKINLSRQN